MKHTIRLIAWIAVCVILVNVDFVFAQDWPQWRGTNRDGKVAGFKAPAKWPAEMTQKWKITVGTGDATPALVEGKLYVFTRIDADEVIQCLDAASGKKLWEDKYAAISVTGAPSSHPGPRSSPTVLNGKVITLGVGGVLSCLDKNSGKVLWRNNEFTNALPRFFTGMSPIIADKMCIAHLGGSDQGYIIAIDLDTGKEKWRWSGDGPAYASPILLTVENTKQVVFQAEKNIVSIAVDDGRLLWQVPTPAQQMSFNCASPIVDGQTVFYTGQGSGTKALTVQKQGNGFNVKELWSNNEFGTAFNTPVLKDGLLFGLSNRGKLYCMKAGTGQIAWAGEIAHKNFGALLDAGSVILALTSDPEFIVFKPNGEKYEELARIKVADTPVYAHPVIAGNVIYVKDENTLTMFTIE
jgi:outer membrane protein assembly factor BamB